MSRAWGVALVVALAVGCDPGDDGDSGAGDSGATDGGTTTTGADSVDESTGSTAPEVPEVPEVPDSSYCTPVSDWTPMDSAFEQEVLELVNEARAQARSCGGESFDATSALSMEPRLRCAARVHSLDMATRGFFDHVNPDGETPFDRIEEAGYQFQAAGENIAAGQTSPAEVVAGWLDSPGHCSNIMSPDYVHIGVGYVYTESGQYPHYWTQTFGAPL
ncbi:MAG: CAP domain-containing protein [Myxococcales bacterium]|nr:CAP domain-containing protein [Myxococcales bacterium]MCB9717029.1 CAP domain-containing protein [Myxococcales bacterium]